MRGMVLFEQRPIHSRPLVMRDLPDPVPGPGELLIRISMCGICHTDLHIAEGDLPPAKLPVVLGHQVVGYVEEVGEGVRNFSKGERVGVPWVHKTCNRCRYCIRGMENLCEDAAFTGYHVDGGYAEMMVVPEGFAYRIPDGIPDEMAAPFLCGGVIGFRALKMSGVKFGGRLGLYGFGSSAHIVIQIAVRWGCEVLVFTRSEEHRKLAWELGASWVGGAEDIPQGKLDAAIIFAPAGWIVPYALEALERGGTVVLAGIHMSPIPSLDYKRIYWEKNIRTVANSTREDVIELLNISSRMGLKARVELFELKDANEALIKLKEAKISGSGVLRIRG